MAKLIGSVPARPLPHQDILLCHSLGQNHQDILILGAVILLYVLFLCLFVLPKSNSLLKMWMCGAGAKEEIKGIQQCDVA